MSAAAVAAGAMAVAVTAGGGGGPIWVNGLMRSTAGTQTMHMPGLHFPIGGVFTGPDAPKPAGSGEAFLGRMTVQANGDPMAYAVLPALTCWFTGMLSLSHNSEHTRRGSMSLPTSVMLPIPASRPVLVGGPPVPSIAALAGIAMRAAFSHGLSRPSRACTVSRAIQDRVGNGQWGNFVSLVARWVFGEPVNGITGEVVVQQHDFTVPGRLPLVWNRRYASHDTRLGAVGCGWQSPADIRIELFEHDDEIGGIVYFPDTWVCFDQMPADEGRAARIIEGIGGHALYLDGAHLIVRSREGIEYRFALPERWREQALAGSPQQPLRSWLVQFNDLNGNAWRIELPREGGLRFIEWSDDAPTGRIVHCAPGDVLGCIGRVILHDAEGRIWPLACYEQNARSDLIAVHDALDNPYRFEYAGEHVMVRHTDRNGLSFYYSHQMHEDGLWRVDHAWGDGGLYDYRFEYDLTYRETRITDSLGGLMRLQCDQRGLPVMLIDQLGSMSSYRYDGWGRTVAAVDPAGNRTTWEYDVCGNLLSHTLPNRSETHTEYDDNLRPIAITDPEGGEWKQAWDTRGNLVKQTTPSGLVMAFAYDPRGQLVQVRNAAQQVTTLAYDPLGYLVGLTDPLGRTTRLKHDARGKLIERQAPGEESATYRWDAKGRLAACMLPGYRLVSCKYDAEDNPMQYTDEAGHITRFSFYGQGQLASRTDANGNVTRYHYNTEEQLVGVINARGETWHLKRDAVGRLVEEIGYDKRSRRYAYDPAGHLTQSIDPLGQVLAVTCDPLGRITRRAVTGSDQNEAFTYDKRGQLIRASNANSVVKRAYDLDGQLMMELQQHVDATGTLAYAYDVAGRLIEQTRKLQTADSVFEQTLAYTYDALGAPQSIQIDDNEPIRFTRDIAGRLARTRFTGNLEHVYGYDSTGRLTRHATRRAGLHDDDTHFGYDINGNLTERRDSRIGSDQFSYDPLGRILAHTDPTGRLKYFGYDALGDRFKVVCDDDRGENYNTTMARAGYWMRRANW
ncbi:DUF6531 domain-containing protein [Caballeronia sp. LZ034LL]|uniref:DUF6531 domain-containing protein n=1 Tax=Caballeronia sp. LZ034LL TaxID=3038567 RepID=UPI00285AD76D|nr:DUF6531 domain-containing protein [Caballeronia sp. LZ034LL]MDR5837007.1 DUF6531 domain-containing protein [Caballeronia sp. LZ034LL]